MFKWIENIFIKKKSAVALPVPSKKDGEYARAMYSAEDLSDKFDVIDFGEAYNFHMDCGDR